MISDPKSKRPTSNSHQANHELPIGIRKVFPMPNFLEQAEEFFPYTQALRRDFHMHPELGYQEVRTGGIVAKELETLGLEVTKGVGKTGVVGYLEGSKPGPTILLRFDMDALPITEETGQEYASTNPGVMHACGHDGHTAIGLTVAKILHAHRDRLAGTIKFCFQPSEEGNNGEETGGAEMMINPGSPSRISLNCSRILSRMPACSSDSSLDFLGSSLIRTRSPDGTPCEVKKALNFPPGGHSTPNLPSCFERRS